jgi:hypothetical protein
MKSPITSDQKIELYKALLPFARFPNEALGILFDTLYKKEVEKITKIIVEDIEYSGVPSDYDEIEKYVIEEMGFNLRESMDLLSYEQEETCAILCAGDDADSYHAHYDDETIRTEKEITGAY